MTDYLLYLSLGVLLTIGITTAMLVLYPPKKLSTSLVVIAVVVLSPMFMYNPVLKALGYSVKVEEQLDTEYLAYSISSDNLWIYLWTLDKEVGEPRAYRIPYTKEDEEKLAKAEEEKGRGVPQKVKKGPTAPTGNDFADGSLVFEPLPDGGVGK
jgi:hypothetical protein